MTLPFPFCSWCDLFSFNLLPHARSAASLGSGSGLPHLSLQNHSLQEPKTVPSADSFLTISQTPKNKKAPPPTPPVELMCIPSARHRHLLTSVWIQQIQIHTLHIEIVCLCRYARTRTPLYKCSLMTVHDQLNQMRDYLLFTHGKNQGKLFYDEYRQHPGMGDLSKNKFGNIEYIYTESRTNYYYK